METIAFTKTRDKYVEITHYVTTDEALALIKKSYVKGVTYFLRLSTTFVTQVDDEGNADRGYSDMTASLAVSQADALKVVKDWMSKPFEEKGARLKITISTHTEWGGKFVHIG